MFPKKWVKVSQTIDDSGARSDHTEGATGIVHPIAGN